MNLYTSLADIVVVLHMAYVLFVIFGLVAILLGYVLKWNWVRNFWFRCIHTGMIGIVVVESLLSITCPLTTLENWLRSRAGTQAHAGSFVGRLVHDLLFIDVSPEWFPVLYCGFGALVVASLILAPPRWNRAALKS